MKHFDSNKITEKYIISPDGRTVAYDDNGDRASNRIVVFYSGTLSVGVADLSSKYLTERGIHYIAPTMPGYGETSEPLSGVSFLRTVASDLTAILQDLHPNTKDLELYICGGSFGTIIAQMIYGAEADIFPAADQIKGMLLLAAFPPAKCSRDPVKANFNWMKYMTWGNWIMVGPPSRIWPLGALTTSAFSSLIASKVRTKSDSEMFIKQAIFDIMDIQEKERYNTWRENQGLSENYLVESMASMNRRSVAKSLWALKNGGDIIHGNWYENGAMLEDKLNVFQKRYVLVVAGESDTATPMKWNEYTAKFYPNSKLKRLPGSHIASLFHMEQIWKDFMEFDSFHDELEK
ncbi:hypothetical protein HK103_003479 [Boothiomyces macroporosus]|uniref:Uncharacterized protein n=1 Tax=Boothiomyces macroporosus TaxID=261099 RepID=A0AAD5Y019_9FUNG|nr:hypothetical protein HK103_003479 [Boothiomyces macroporosus]